MRTSVSTEQQKDYWLRKTEDGKHYIRIRMNHREIEREDMEGETTTMWQCDEVEVMMPQRADIEQYVKNHHKALFYFAEPELLVEKLSELLGE